MKSFWFRKKKISCIALFSLLVLAGCEQAAEIHTWDALERAREYQDKGNLRSAVLELKNLLQQTPNNMAARLLLGQLHLQAGDGLAAKKELRLVLESKFTAESELAIDLARTDILNGATEELTKHSPNAISVLVEKYNLNPQRKARLFALYGQGYLIEGRVEDADSLFDKALKIDPEETEAFLGKAILAAWRVEMDESREWIAKALDKNAQFSPVWSLLGDIERYHNNPQAAEHAYSEAIQYRYYRAHDLYGRSLSRIAQGNYTNATEDLESLRSFAGWDAEVNFLRGLLALQKSENTEALALFQKSLNIKENFMPSILYAGIAAALLGQVNQAEAFLERYVWSNPSSNYAIKQLALVKTRKANYAEAATLLKKILRDVPDDVEALDIIATGALLEGNNKEAVEHLERVALAQPNSSTVYMKLGVGLIAQGDNQRAEKVLEHAWETAPESQEAAILLFRNHMTAGELDKARQVAEAMRDRHPEEAMPYVMLGTVSLQQNDKEAARSAFTTALEKNPGEFAAAKALSVLALEQNDKELATSYLESFLLGTRPGAER